MQHQPEGLTQPSPGQSEAPPWVPSTVEKEPCKGETEKGYHGPIFTAERTNASSARRAETA